MVILQSNSKTKKTIVYNILAQGYKTRISWWAKNLVAMAYLRREFDIFLSIQRVFLCKQSDCIDFWLLWAESKPSAGHIWSTGPNVVHPWSRFFDKVDDVFTLSEELPSQTLLWSELCFSNRKTFATFLQPKRQRVKDSPTRRLSRASINDVTNLRHWFQKL